MNKNFLIILLVFGLLQTINAQDKSDIVVIDTKYNISIPSDKFVKEISLQRGLIKKTKKELLQQCIDSTKYYGGNFFKIIYLDDNEFVTIKKELDLPVYIRGNIYNLDENEIQKIQKDIQNYKYSKSDSTQIIISEKDKDSKGVIYEANFVFQYGGESKLALFLPKVNLLRKHQFDFITPYYGIELGLHAGFVGGYGSLSGIIGVERNIISFETSVSHFRTTKISDGDNSYNGPFSQNLLNLKLGFQISKVRLKVGTSFLLNEKIPQGQERIGLLDLGKINGTIYGIEIQFKIK